MITRFGTYIDAVESRLRCAADFDMRARAIVVPPPKKKGHKDAALRAAQCAASAEACFTEALREEQRRYLERRYQQRPATA